MSALLELVDVEAGYGPFRALFGVSLAVEEGQALALLGSNGAGKTTVARVCSGLVHPTAGRVMLDGDDIGGRHPYEIVRLGIAQAPEGRSVFASLSVEENLILGFRQALGRSGARAALDRAYDGFPRLGERRTQLAGTLSGGEQRMLSLARVLGNPPRLLVADELSLGLAPIVVEDVYQALVAIREAGTTLVVVEQQVAHALDLADVAVVLESGRVGFSGPADELAARRDDLTLG
jgi:branched-chain amino acid transport system ATP-binding protein